MARYQYKTVPAPMVLSIKKKQDGALAIEKFSEIMNSEAENGWEFYSMETITTEEAPGCFPSQNNEKRTHYNMLVFRREADV